jgi:hypothetical protein
VTSQKPENQYRESNIDFSTEEIKNNNILSATGAVQCNFTSEYG